MGLAGHREREADQKPPKMRLVVWSDIYPGRKILALALTQRPMPSTQSDRGADINPICGGGPAFCRSNPHRQMEHHIPLDH
jgi:hypothetical protein